MKLNVFHISDGRLYVFLGEVSVQVLSLFFHWIVCLVFSCMSSLYILIVTPCQSCCWQISSPSWLVLVHRTFCFVVGFFCCAEAFEFYIVHSFPFAFTSLAFGVKYIKCYP